MKSQFLSLVVGRGIASLMLVGMGVLVARWAGPYDFGVLATVLSVGAVFFVFFDFGMSTFISRSEARGEKTAVAAALRANTTTSALGGLVAAAVVVLVSSGGGPVVGMVCLVLALALEKNVETSLSIPIARGNRGLPVESLMIRRVVAILLLLVLHAVGVDPIECYGIAMLGGAAIGQIHIRMRLRADYKFGGAESRVYRRAFPFMVSNISASMRNLDVAVLSVTLGTQAGGIYAAAQRLTSPFMLIPGVVASLVLPHAAKGSQRRGLAILNKLVLGHVGLLALLVTVSLSADQIVSVVLGEQYSQSGPVLAWLLIAFPFIALSSPMGGVLQSQGHERGVAVNGAVFALSLFPVLYFGAVLWGPVGAAVGVFSVYMAKCIALYLMATKYLR